MSTRRTELLDLLSQTGTGQYAVGVAFEDGAPRHTHFTYPQAYLDTYQAGSYALIDPTLAWGFRNTGTITWDELIDSGHDPSLMALASDHGLRAGVCFSVKVFRWPSIASIVVDDPAEIDDTRRDAILGGMELATLEAAREAQDDIPDRSRELLEASVTCRDDKEMAIHLDLTVSGVRRRRRETLTRMNARSLPEAIYKATLSGVLFP